MCYKNVKKSFSNLTIKAVNKLIMPLSYLRVTVRRSAGDIVSLKLDSLMIIGSIEFKMYLNVSGRIR